MLETKVEVRGNKVCLYASLSGTDGKTTIMLDGQPVVFKVVSVGTKQEATTSVEPILIMDKDAARRMARQILSDCKEA